MTQFCGKLNSHVSVSNRLEAQRPLRPYRRPGIAAGGLQFMYIVARPRAATAAEVLFMRKQLAYYQDHQIRPRPLTDAATGALVSAV